VNPHLAISGSRPLGKFDFQKLMTPDLNVRLTTRLRIAAFADCLRFFRIIPAFITV